MASYNTVPAEDTRLQEAPKSWKLKKIVVVSAALSFSLGACAATALSYREVGASRATQLVAQTDCQAKYPNLCSDDGCKDPVEPVVFGFRAAARVAHELTSLLNSQNPSLPSSI